MAGVLEAPLSHDLNQDQNDDNSQDMVDDTALSAGYDPTPGDSNDLTVTSDQISVYVVHKGDTLSQIAKMFKVSANTILWSNDIPKGGSVREGQQLVILPISGVQYTVKKGDTVAKIAKKFGGDPDEIIAFNNIGDDGVKPGDAIVVPNGIEAPMAAPSSNPVKKLISDVVNAFAGYFMRPVGGVRTQGLHGHNAVDFGVHIGTNVAAAASGQVIISISGGYNGGYGSYIVIKHPNGMQTLYAHLSQNLVSSGDTVWQGQVIGLSGNTGRSTGPHLHFEVRGGYNPFQ